MAFLGIDLGTTFSAMAYLDRNGLPTTISNSDGDTTTPSVVLFEKSGDIIVGREARRAALAEPGSVAECVKRHMGDAVFPKIIHGKSFTPVEISSLILLKLAQDARKKIDSIEGVVITVPAYFDEARRQATAKAGLAAGLLVLDIINEPTSAALAYAYRTFQQEIEPAPASNMSSPNSAVKTAAIPAPPAAAQSPRVVLVYDLGGGTFDVTFLKLQGKDLTVLATAGDVRLGGRDWDERLFNHMADLFIRVHGEDPRDDPVSLQNLMLLAEETKKVLSSRKQAKYVVNHAGKTMAQEISRQQFDELTQDLLYRSENRLNRLMKQAKLSWAEVDKILAVGGSTRMPQVLEMLRRVTGKEPDCSLSPDEAVAHGAAVHAGICAARPAIAKMQIPPAPPVPLPPLKSALGKPLPLPELSSPNAGAPRAFRTHVVDLLRSIRTTNVNAHTLGVIVTYEGYKRRVTALIPSNTQLPYSIKRRFGTAQKNQKSVTVRVVEGESEDPEDCLPVGACSIERLPGDLPQGSPVEVTFTYDNSGRLHVEAIEVSSGKSAQVSIARGRDALDSRSDKAKALPELGQKRIS